MSQARLGFTFALSLAGAVLLGARAAGQQQNWDDVEIKTHTVAAGIAMLEGPGGNIGVCSGPDGVFMIDDKFAPLTDKIRAAVAALSDKPIRFVLNTHMHGDHTGGNENLGKAGVTIVAHDNVRVRLATEQFSATQNRAVPAAPREALPVVTFSDSLTFHMNGHTVVVFHVAPAHTDGDAIVHFREANVIHTGDCLFIGRYPVIDVRAGGSLDGMIAAQNLLLSIANEQTRIIPGHGPVTDRGGLLASRDMLAAVRDRIRPMVAAKTSADAIVAARPTAEFDTTWGGRGGAERFVRAVVAGMGGQ